MRSGAIKIFDKADELCEKLAEGDIYSVTCQLVNLSQCDRGEAAEDTLLYMLSCERLKALCRSSTPFSEHFSAPGQGTAEDRRKARYRASMTRRSAAMMVEVASLVRRSPITVDAGMTIRETAAMMSNKDVSSVMVMQGEKLVGLVTDRDLRRRCVAIGLIGSEPIDHIMTPNPEVIEGSTLTAQALMTMTRIHFHHLPVTRTASSIGMITATDLANHQSANSAYLAVDVRKAKTVADLIEVSTRLPTSAAAPRQRQRHRAAYRRGGLLHDRFDHRPPARDGRGRARHRRRSPMCGWPAARRPAMSRVRIPIRTMRCCCPTTSSRSTTSISLPLAKFVSDGLNAVRLRVLPGRCHGDQPPVASTAAGMAGLFHGWIESPSPMSMMLSSIFFDLRPVTGDTELFTPLQTTILKKSQENRIFLAYMMANAMQHRPPLGFFRQFVLERGGEHDDTLDLKHRGIVPITDIARRAGPVAGQGAGQHGRAPAGLCRYPGAVAATWRENLEDALEFIASLRIQHQANQIRNGRARGQLCARRRSCPSSSANI